jgi:GT2 family glycosyltransferase
LSWNTRALLLECIESVLGDTSGFEAELIVVDNASRDDSVRAVGERFAGVRLIVNQANLGFAKGNNAGIAASRGRYVCLLNSDIVVHPGCFRRLVDLMDENPQVGIAGPKLLNLDLTIQKSCKTLPDIRSGLFAALGLSALFPGSRFFDNGDMSFFDHRTQRSVDAIAGAFWIIRRCALEVVGPLDEHFFFYGEDIDWCRRFRAKGWDVRFFPEAQAMHHEGGSSKFAPITYYIQQCRTRFYYWKKYSGVGGAMAAWCITLLHDTLRLALSASTFLLMPSQRKKTAPRVRRFGLCTLWLLGAPVDRYVNRDSL